MRMEEYIREVIQRFGGRLGGSAQEKQAQEFTQGLMRDFCDSTNLEPFRSALGAHFGSLKLFCILFWAALGLYWFNPGFATWLAIANAVLFIGHFLTYRHWLDFLYKQQESWNVTGVIEPADKATSTLIIAGHIDSVPEFQWWYKLGNFGGALNFIAGFSFVLQAIYYIVLLFTGTDNGWSFNGWLVFVVLSPATLSFYFKHGKLIVDGALDNLTGVAMAMEMGRTFSKERLKHTRLRIVSFGSEEWALRGAFAYAREHKDELQREHAVLINIDTIKDKDKLAIVWRELNTLVVYPDHLVKKMQAAFTAANLPPLTISANLGASDGSAFHIEGLPAVTVIGLNSEKLDPTYHTRLDNLEHLNPEALYACREALYQFVKKWDEQAAQQSS